MKATAQPEITPVFDFCVDADAQPGALVTAAARLLIHLARRRREQGQGEAENERKPSS